MFLPNNASLPQNSLNPPTAQEIQATNARLYQNFMASRTGRERVYSTLPTVESFWGEGAGLAKDASEIIPGSELARRSVLNGLSPLNGHSNAAATAATVTGTPVLATAPTVLSLNAPSHSLTMPTSSVPSNLVSPTQTIMPAAAPVPGPYGYMNPPAIPSMAALPAPASVQNDGMVQSSCGLSGYAPPWSDAFATAVAPQPATDPNMPFYVLGAILLAAFGLSQLHEHKAAA